MVTAVPTCNGIQQCSCKQLVFYDIYNFLSLQSDDRKFWFIDFSFLLSERSEHFRNWLFIYILQHVSSVWIGYYQLGLQYNKWNIRLRCKYLFQSLENKIKILIYRFICMYVYYYKDGTHPFLQFSSYIIVILIF